MTPTLARKKSQFLEDQIQAALVQHIELRGVPGLVYFHVPNSSKPRRRPHPVRGAIGGHPGQAVGATAWGE